MKDLHCSHGPVSTLPGSYAELPPGTVCDDHPDVLAFKRVQTETDSFGCEYACLCEPCFVKFKADVEEDRKRPRKCDWCKTEATDCRPTRDYDEGMAGPVYNVCEACRTKQTEAAYAEIGDRDDYDCWGDGWDE